MRFATFSVSGGLVQKYIDAGIPIPFHGTMAVEGIETGDSRGIAPGALTWRDLPLPFMVQLENPVAGQGHDGAVIAGRIDTIERLDSGELATTGVIDPSLTPDAMTFARAMDQLMMRGVSIDVDRVKMLDVKTANGKQQIITEGRIMGLTGTPFASFMEAFIEFDIENMVDPDNETDEAAPIAASAGQGSTARIHLDIDGIETLVASGGQSIPVEPPEAWFADQQLKELTPLTITPSGQVFGHIAAWGTCHISFAGKCVPVPKSRTNYAAFRNGTVITAEGTSVRTGPIVMDTVHPDLRWQASDAQAFYANTGSALLDVVPYEDRFGIAIAGAARPTAKPEQLRALRGSDISPDWRTINGVPRECCAMLAVNNSGFKLPQTLVASAGMMVEPGDVAVALDHDEVYALVASGPMSVEPCCSECAAHDHDDDADDPVELSTEMTETETETVVVAPDPDRLAAFASRFGPKPPRQFRAAVKPNVRVFGANGGFKPFEKKKDSEKKDKPKGRPFRVAVPTTSE